MTNPTPPLPKFAYTQRTAMEAARAKLRTHQPASDGTDVIVTVAFHPHVFEAFEAISHDSGFSAGHDFYCVPAFFAPELPVAETFLSNLSAAEQNTFAIGEYSEVMALADRSPEGLRTAMFLNRFFEDWMTEEDYLPTPATPAEDPTA